MTITRVSTGSGTHTASATSSPVTCAYTSNVTAGDFLWVAVCTYTSGTPSTCTVTVDDNGVGAITFTQIGSYLTLPLGHARLSLWYAKNVSGGACTVRVTPSASAYVDFGIEEDSGVDTSSPIDSNNSGSGSSGTGSPSTSAVTVGGSDEMIIGVLSWESATTPTVTAGTGFTNRFVFNNGTSFLPVALEDYIGVSSNTAASWSISPFIANWGALAASIKPSAGGTTYTLSVTDNLALSDSIVRNANANRIVSSNFGISDSFSRLANASRIVSESLALSDALSRQANANRIASDNLGISDFFSRLASANRTLSDSFGIVDALLRHADAFRILIDNLAIGDSASLVKSSALLIQIIDSLGFTTIASRHADANRVSSDSFGLSDMVIRHADANRLLSDSLGISTLLLRQADAARQLLDSLGQADILLRQADAYRLLVDYIGIADAVAVAIGVLSAAGPIFIANACVYVPGAVAGEAFVPGAEEAEVHYG